MSYGYPGQGYGPGGGHQQHGAPQYGGGYGHQQPPPNQGYGYQQPPPNQGYQQHQAPLNQGYQQQQAPPNHGYEQYPPQQGYGQHALQQQRQYQRPPGPPSHGEDRWGRPSAAHGSSRDVHAPPTGTQQFGHGAPQGYTFQYSECTGKRRALLIGINYTRTGKGVLKGCVNDVDNLSEFLIRNHGYKREDMVILVDRDEHTPEMNLPNKGNIIRAMQWLVAGAQRNDALFLHYSGHGGQTEDLDGDEEDGHDEVIYPLDFQTAGHIVDDEIHHHVVKPLPAGVRLTAIFDSCHSGSVLDLPYLYSTKGVLKEPNLAKEAGQGFLEAAGHYARGDVGSALSSVLGFAKTAFKGNDAYEQTKRTKTSPADVVMWSGCKDEQTSADATIASQATGAMSHAFIDALSKKPQQSYVELLNNIRDFLQAKYSQKPQLSCSHPLDTDLLFVM